MVEYRPIKGFPGYKIGNDGSVWIAWRNCSKGRILTNRWKQMRISPNAKGYLRVNLVPAEGGGYKTFRVHRLVLESFVGPCPKGMECRHLNGIKTDCTLENLAWGTPEKNRQDNRDMGVYQKGSNHSQSKLTEEQVAKIRELYASGKFYMRQLAEQFNCSLSMVSHIVNRKSWVHV